MTDNGHPIGGLAMQAGGVPTFMKLIKKLTNDIKKAEKAGDLATSLEKRKELNNAIQFGVNDPLMPRAQPLTQAEIRMYAERMAPQVAGELTRGVDAKTVAGKSQKQFKREQTLPVDRKVLPGAVDPSAPLPYMTLEDQKGSVLLGLPGDPTLARVSVSGIGDVPFEQAVTQHGGPRYGDDEKLWASNLSAATGLLNAADRASRQFGDAPVIASYMKMPTGFGFAQHYLETLLQYQRPDLLNKAAREALEKDIKEGFVKQGKRVAFPNFPGFDDLGAVAQAAENDSNLRKHIAAKLGTSEKYGLRPAADVQFAVSHPELTNLETGASGFTLGELIPGRLTESAHPTYSHDIPGKVLGQMQYSTPYDLLYRDQLELIRKNPEAPEFNTLKMLGARQKIDEQLVNEINEYQERMRQLLGRKKGGAVKKAEGGSLTDLPDEVNPSNWREHLQNNVRADARALLGAKDGGVINLDELIEKSLKKKDGGVINLDELIAWTLAKDEHRKMKEGGAVKMAGGGNPGEVAGDMFKPKPLSIPEPITDFVEALRRQFEKEKRSMRKPGAVQDVLLRGPAAAAMGAPADIVGMGGELLDYAQKKIPALRKPASVMDTGPEKTSPMGYAPVFPLSPEGSYGTTAAQELMGKAGLTTGEERPLFEMGATAAAPITGYAGFKAGKALAPTAKEMLDVQLQQMMSPYQMNVIKPEGGNWIKGAAQKYVEPVRAYVFDSSGRADPAMRLQSLNEKYGPYGAEEVLTSGMYPLIQEKAALNRFVDKKLAKYIQNEMGTPSDPLRLQADAWADTQQKLMADKQKQIDKVRADIEKARQERNVNPEVLTRSQARLRELQKEQDLIKNRKGIHYVPESSPVLGAEARRKAGMPEENMGGTPTARRWENLTDRTIMQSSYRDKIPLVENSISAQLSTKSPEEYAAVMRQLERESLERLGGQYAVDNPEALAYGMNTGIPARDLGFDHMMDELQNALVNEALPEYLRLTPKTLDKMSVTQAAEHVDKINAWRASQKAEVDKARAANAATVVHKEYPEQGLKWVELKMPEENAKRLSQIDTLLNAERQGGEYGVNWLNNTKGEKEYFVTKGSGKNTVYLEKFPTEEEALARKNEISNQSVDVDALREERKALTKEFRQQQLEDALKYEGEILQHCVGGYCPDVVEGRSRIFSLRDEEGRPHATIEVEPEARIGFRQGEGPKTPDEDYALRNQYVAGVNDGSISNDMTFAEWWRSKNNIPEPVRPERISQIKGLQNKKPEAEFIPYIQDFVKSGDWSQVGDIHHTDLFKVTPGQKLPGFSKEIEPGYYTLEDFQKMAVENEMPQEILDHWMNKLGGRRFFGMKRGGRITKADLEREYRMAFGGGVFNTDPDITDAGRIIPEHTI